MNKNPSTPSIPAQHLNVTSYSRYFVRKGSQTLNSKQQLGKSDYSLLSTLYGEHSSQQLLIRQNSIPKLDLPKFTQKSTSYTPRQLTQDKKATDVLLYPQINNNRDQDSRTSLCSQYNYSIKNMSRNQQSRTQKISKEKESLPNQNKNQINYQNFIRLKSTPNICKKIYIQTKQEKSSEMNSMKLSDVETPKYRTNNNERNIQPKIDLKSISQDKFQNNNRYSSNSNEINLQFNLNDNNNTLRKNIFSAANSPRDSYYYTNQYQNEKIKLNNNSKQELFKKRLSGQLSNFKRNPTKVQTNTENDQELGAKNIVEESNQEPHKLPFNQKQIFYQMFSQKQQLNQQLQNIKQQSQQVNLPQQQLHNIQKEIQQKQQFKPSIQQQSNEQQEFSQNRSSLMNTWTEEKNLYQNQQKNLLISPSINSSKNIIENPAQHLLQDVEDTKKQEKLNKNNYYYKKQYQNQQINSMSNQIIASSVQRSKYFDQKCLKRSNSKKSRLSSIENDEDLEFSKIFEEDESLYSYEQRKNSSIISRQIQRQNNLSSCQSYDQIHIWGSSGRNNYHTSSLNKQDQLQNLSNNENNEERQKEFLKLYTKRYKNYPEQFQGEKKFNDEEIKAHINKILFSQDQDLLNQESPEEYKQSLNQQLIIPQPRHHSTPIKSKQNSQEELKNNIAYEVAVMQINTPNVSGGTFHLSNDSTSSKYKVLNIFISDDKQKREQCHNEFIKCFFLEKK